MAVRDLTAISRGMAAPRATPSLKIGGLLVGLFLAAALLAPLLAPYPPNEVGAGISFEPPGRFHPLGTDQLGRDMLSRVLYGARAALVLGSVGLVVAAGLGITLGLAAGYYGGWVERSLARLVEVWLAFPGLLLAVVVVARLGPSLTNAALALGIASAPGFFRLARAEALCQNAGMHVEAAHALGASDLRVIVRHVLPNIASSLLVLVTMRAGALILAGGGLSFVGLGAQPPAAEWGALLAAGREHMNTAPWLALYPGICITLTVAGLNLLGDGLRDWFDPRR